MEQIDNQQLMLLDCTETTVEDWIKLKKLLKELKIRFHYVDDWKEQ